MADKYHILYWRDIPSMVKAKIGRKRLSHPLPDRFMEAIDAAAMKTGDTNTDQYLADWRQSEQFDIEGDAQTYLETVGQRLEQEFPRERLIALAKNGGLDPSV